MITRTEKSTHWYYPDGEPCFEVPAKKGGMRNTTVKDARALGLLPSVTTVLGLLAKPQLEAWKQEQAILASLTLPRVDGESDDDFAKRVVVDAQEQSKKAMALGTSIHDAIENWLLGETVDPELFDYVQPVINWIEQEVDLSKPFEVEKRLASAELGFAGRTDLVCYLKSGLKAMIDWKSKNTKEKYKHMVSFYDEECWQLSAYSMIEKCDVCINIGISTSQKGTIGVKTWSNDEIVKGMEIFKSALNLFKLVKEL